MIVNKLNECGYDEAMIGLSLSYGKKPDGMHQVASKLASKGDGHNKFLESMVVWLDIIAPRYWWQQFDTYRIGITKQSASTMHTLMNRELTQADFQIAIDYGTLEHLNYLITTKQFDLLKNELPEGFLQRRIVCLNYKTLRNIIKQRKTHKLVEWQMFIKNVLEDVQYPWFLGVY